MKTLNLMKILPSETVRLNSLALQKIKAGEKVINLTAGEPVMPIPAGVKRAINRCLKLNQSQYPEVAGVSELRIKAAEWMNMVHGSSFTQANTLVVPGGKFGIFILLQAILKKGDEVLIPGPFWVSYPGMVKLFGGRAKVIKTSIQTGWKITASDILRNSTAKTRVLILNNGSNPTGVVYTKKELRLILAAVAEKGLFVISDEVYSGLVYDGQKYVSCSEFNQHRDRVAIIQSCSKNFAIPGFRIGFVFAPTEIIRVLTSLTSQSVSGVSILSQHAAMAVLDKAKIITEKIRREMQSRRNHFLGLLEKSFGVKLIPPQSALYAFVPLSAFGVTKISSTKFCEQALLEANVAIVPGSAFGQEGYVRFSFGDNKNKTTQAINQLSQWLSKK